MSKASINIIYDRDNCTYAGGEEVTGHIFVRSHDTRDFGTRLGQQRSVDRRRRRGPAAIVDALLEVQQGDIGDGVHAAPPSPLASW